MTSCRLCMLGRGSMAGSSVSPLEELRCSSLHGQLLRPTGQHYGPQIHSSFQICLCQTFSLLLWVLSSACLTHMHHSKTCSLSYITVNVYLCKTRSSPHRFWTPTCSCGESYVQYSSQMNRGLNCGTAWRPVLYSKCFL